MGERARELPPITDFHQSGNRYAGHILREAGTNIDSFTKRPWLSTCNIFLGTPEIEPFIVSILAGGDRLVGK